MNSFKFNKVSDGTEFDRFCTEEDCVLLVEAATDADILNQLKEFTLYIDKETFSPFVVWNRIRFPIEPIQDAIDAGKKLRF